ncbi:MAG: FecR domain-containing protein, partial [Cyclobacteriaceae bacterium]
VMQLTKGNLGIISKSGEITLADGDDNILYWKTNLMSFDDEALDTIVKIINSQLDTDIRLSDGIQRCRLTLSFEGKNVEDFFEELKKIKDISIRKSDNTMYIGGEGC